MMAITFWSLLIFNRQIVREWNEWTMNFLKSSSNINVWQGTNGHRKQVVIQCVNHHLWNVFRHTILWWRGTQFHTQPPQALSMHIFPIEFNNLYACNKFLQMFIMKFRGAKIVMNETQTQPFILALKVHYRHLLLNSTPLNKPLK